MGSSLSDLGSLCNLEEESKGTDLLVQKSKRFWRVGVVIAALSLD